MRYTLALPPRRIRKIDLKVKAKALHAICVLGKPVLEVLDEVYREHGRDAGSLARPHVALCQWKSAVERALNSGENPELVRCCEKLGILRKAGT